MSQLVIGVQVMAQSVLSLREVPSMVGDLPRAQHFASFLVQVSTYDPRRTLPPSGRPRSVVLSLAGTTPLLGTAAVARAAGPFGAGPVHHGGLHAQSWSGHPVHHHGGERRLHDHR